MKKLLLVFSCLLLSQGIFAREQVFAKPAGPSEVWRSADTPWPGYLPRGYRFQGISYLTTKGGKITHLRFMKEKKLLSIFSKPSDGKRKKWRMKRKGSYHILEWQKGAKEFTLIGREDSVSLIKIAESIE